MEAPDEEQYSEVEVEGDEVEEEEEVQEEMREEPSSAGRSPDLTPTPSSSTEDLASASATA